LKAVWLEGTMMRFVVMQILKRVSVPVAALLVLSACNVTVHEGRPYDPPVSQQPQMCTKEYAPVCGVRQGRERTFPNSCVARAEGYYVRGAGECGTSQSRPPKWPGRPAGDQNGGWTGGNAGRGQIACTREFAPVCASNGRRNQTFSNACEAENAGFRQLYEGQCR